MPDLNENEKRGAQAPEEEPSAEERTASWKEEMEKSYYYDDAHGYEDFEPEEGSESEED